MWVYTKSTFYYTNTQVKSTTECKRKVLLNASVKNKVLFITLTKGLTKSWPNEFV